MTIPWSKLIGIGYYGYFSFLLTDIKGKKGIEEEYNNITSVIAKTMLLELSKSVVTSISNSPKVHYFWSIRYASVVIFEEYKQYSP